MNIFTVAASESDYLVIIQSRSCVESFRCEIGKLVNFWLVPGTSVHVKSPEVSQV